MSDPRIFRPAPRAAAAFKLFCFPYAGAGAAVYRLWPQHLPETVELVAFHPAGRGHRLREAPLDTVAGMVEAALEAFEPLMDCPFAFFGHSLGAIVASEAARVMQAQDRAPAHLFVSARPPDRDRKEAIHQLPDEEFIRALNQRYQGIPAELMAHPDLLELMLPPLRADIRASELFHPAAGRPKIASPITVFGGTRDRQASVEELEAWGDETAGISRIRMFEGDHFYLDPHRPALLAEIVATLKPHLAATRTLDRVTP